MKGEDRLGNTEDPQERVDSTENPHEIVDNSRAQVAPSPAHPLTSSPGLSRSTKIIGLVSLLSDVSTEMAYPLLPAFITQLLGAPVTALGLIEGFAQGTSSLVTGFSGWISDRIERRKPVALLGYVMTAASKPVIAAALAWPVVFAARFADRFGKGIRSAPRDAMLAESTSDRHRGRAYGFERAMDSSGAVLGPLVALALVGWAGFGTRAVLLLSALPAAVAAVLILLLRERQDQIVSGAASLRLTLAGTTLAYRRLLVVVGVFGIANSANAFLILRAQQLGLSIRLTILAYALYNAVAAIGAMPAGVASDRFGRRRVLAIGYLIYALVYFGFAVASNAWPVWPLFAAYGLFPALTEGASKALAVDTAGEAGRATAVGIYSAVVGITQIAASYIGGLLWEHIDPRAAFYFGAAVAATALVLLFALLQSDSNR